MFHGYIKIKPIKQRISYALVIITVCPKYYLMRCVMTKFKFEKTDFIDIVRGILYSIIFSLVFVMLFALIVKFTNLSESVIAPVNIAIKIVSILLGCLIGIKRGKKGIIKGLIIGLFFSLLTYLIFSLINNSFKINPLTVYDVLSCIAASIISGIIAVNIRTKVE